VYPLLPIHAEVRLTLQAITYHYKTGFADADGSESHNGALPFVMLARVYAVRTLHFGGCE
jgi:hypothetical protein